MLRRRNIFLVIIMSIGLCFIYLDMSHIVDTPEMISLSHQYILQNHHKPERKGIINTEGCTIPNMGPLDLSVKSFVEYPSDMPKCRNPTTALLASNRTTIWVRRKILKFYKVANVGKLNCCYQSFYRPVTIKNISSSKIDDRVKYNSCVKFYNNIKVKHEFVRVKCSVKNKPIYDYEQYFLFAPIKVLNKLEKKNEIVTNPGYNVLIIGIDSVSRLNFLRTMPKTADYLKRKGAIDMLGYNKVGYNTFPNLVPMLMGVKVTEVYKLCYPNDTATFDNCPFIWKRYKQAEYYTAYVEDCTHIATFNYYSRGFDVSPTDYYTRTFLHEAELHIGPCAKLCMNDIYYYKVLLNYIEDITWRLKTNKLFGLFWENSVSHDDLNWPMKMDKDYEDMFIKLEARGYLEETIVLFVSDHGIRWGPIRATKQGRLEELLPFLYVLTPNSFKKNYKRAFRNLQLNSHRLTTPFDVYETLSDLIDLKNVSDSVLQARCKESYALRRGISLFLPVPSNRTCKAADIDDQWCTCRKEVPIDNNNSNAYKAAQTLINTFNSLLRDYTECSKLELSAIIKAMEVQVGKVDKDRNPWKEFMVVVKAAPSGAIYEATLRYHVGKKSWELAGAPSRLNKYGDQAWCTDNKKLQPYCYCRSQNANTLSKVTN